MDLIDDLCINTAISRQRFGKAVVFTKTNAYPRQVRWAPAHRRHLARCFQPEKEQAALTARSRVELTHPSAPLFNISALYWIFKILGRSHLSFAIDAG